MLTSTGRTTGVVAGVVRSGLVRAVCHQHCSDEVII